MAANPSTILRRASTDRIGRALKSGSIPNVGQFGTTGDLPGDPGGIEPPILTEGPPSPPSATDFWTREDPGFGYLPPSVEIDPSQGSGLFHDSPDPMGDLNSTAGLSAMGPFPGGNMGGPQGSVYGINPVTGNTIYNVTGSPRPGFFDSRTGRVATALGSTALNMFVPGLGFVSKAVFDAFRRNNAARNTGTDLSGRQNRPSGGGQVRSTGTGTWTAGTGTPVINVATGQQELNRSGAGHNAAAHAAALYNMSQSYSPVMPRPHVADFRGYMDAEGVQHNPRMATPSQIMAAFRRGSHPYQNPSNLATDVTAAQINAFRRPITRG